MFDKFRYLSILAAVCLMMVGCANKKEIAKLNQQILQLQSENDSLKQDLAAAQSKLTEKSGEEQRLTSELNDLKAKLAGTGAEPGIKGGRIFINLPSSIYFDSGKSTLKKEAKRSLRKVGSVIKEQFPTDEISIQGHTDNRPIKKSKYKSNLELSNERAEAVWHFLADECSIPPERMHTAGYSMYKPIADNKTSKGRRANRRVEIVIIRE